MIFRTVSEIYSFLDESRRKLSEQVANLSPEKANYRRDEKSWSVAQIVEHLEKTEGGLIRVFKSFANQMNAQEFDGTLNPPVSFEEIAAQSSDVKMEAPLVVVPGGETKLEDSLANLQKSRETLYGLKSLLESRDLSKSVYPHPYFGDMNVYQWLVMIGFHELRHTAQIERIFAEIKN